MINATIGRGPVLVAGALGLAAVLVLTGCTGDLGPGRGFGGSAVLADVAGRLSNGEAAAYTATYATRDNHQVTIAHTADPARTAYTFPGGRVIVTATGTLVCHTPVTVPAAGATIKPAKPAPVPRVCATVPSAATAAGGRSQALVDRAIEGAGLVRPQAVVALLTSASVNADVIVSERDTRMAGTATTCVDIGGVTADRRFSMCVTADGLLASFAGNAGTTRIALTLTSYTLTTAESAFTTQPQPQTPRRS